MRFTLRQDYEFNPVRYDSDFRFLLEDDIYDAISSNDDFRADYEIAHAEELQNCETTEDFVDRFLDYCLFAAESAVSDAVRYGVAHIADLTITTCPRPANGRARW